MTQRKLLKKALATVLCIMMFVSIFPLSALAEWNNVTYDGKTFGTNGYYNVISKKDYVLVPGAATETEMVLNNSTSSRRQVMHIIEVDPSNPDVSIIPGYYGIDKFQAEPNNTNYHKAAGVTNVAEYYDTTLGYQVVGAMNTALAYDCNAPFSYLVYNGEVLVDAKGGVNNFHSGVCQTILCVYKDEETGKCSCELRTNAQGLRGDEWQAIGANFAMTVNNGQLVNKTENHNGGSDDAARSMVGIKEDGTLVLVMNDGRGSNNSKGFCSYELGESMLALGCKWAFNCDGGGSSSFVTRRVGEENLTCRCVPCDGAERPTLNSVLVVSNVAATGELDNVKITANYDYLAPGTTYTFGATAIDTHGYSMDMPTDVVWSLSDDSFGTVSDGTFVSNGKIGQVTVQTKLNNVVVGEKDITIANPTTLGFTQASTVLPYGKSTTLEFNSFIGEERVFLDGSSFEFSLSVPAAGTMNGLTFTATTDESIEGTTVTATYVPTGDTYTYAVSFGKGSEIVWDFEDGDLHGFLGQQDAYDWQLEHGVKTPFGYSGDGLNTLVNKGQISTDVSSSAFISTVENGGKVHNGEKALGFTFDMTQDAFNEWTYCVIFNVSNVNGDVVLRDVANGKKATTFGCWVYVPYGFYTAENSGALALQANLFGGASKESAAQIGLNMQYNGKNLNALTENDIPENRWVYVKTDISAYNYVSLVDPLQTDFRSPSVMRMYVKPSVAQKLTYYFDDFTLDYSSAVDDRVPPVISNPQYAPNDTNIAFTDGVTITEESAGFTAYISDDNSGIDASSAAIYVDGNKLSTTKVNGNMIYCDAVALGVGTHKVKFEIADKLGNYTTLTRTIISNTDNHHMKYRTRIELDGHNASGTTPTPGSVYYIDVCNNYSEPLGTAKFTLLLNTANEWILDGIEAVDGYDVTYSVNPSNENEVTFTVSSSKMNGNKVVMFSIPVRVYNPLITNGTSDGSAVTVSGKTFVAPLTVEMTSCTVAGSYGNYYKFSIAAMDSARKIERHEHNAVAVADKAATCTEAGYTGRTYCEDCGSIVDWGQTVPATGHSYKLVDGHFICDTCGDEFDLTNYTGLIEASGSTYYAIAGNLQSGWIVIDDEWYYFSPATKANVATTSNGKVTFKFDENGKLTHGEWYYDGTGYKYYYCGTGYYKCVAGNSYANANWVEIDGHTYCFDRNGYRHEGIRVIRSSNDPAKLYEFTGEGALVGEYVTTEDGLFQCNGYKCYLKNGAPTQTGLIKVGNDFYYIDSTYTTVVNGSYKLTNMGNYGIPAGTYEFDAEGRMINPPLKNGPDGDDFFINGEKAPAYTGLVEYEGNFYYIAAGGKIVKDISDRYINKTNDLTFTDGTPIPNGYYTFDSDGKMLIKNGPDGDYFYVNGIKVAEYTGLVEYEGNFYYVAAGAKLVKNIEDRAINKTNDLTFADGTPIPDGKYTFDETGKMLVKNGPDGDYFYVNGIKAAEYTGLVEYEGNFYYVAAGAKLVKNISDRYINKTNDLTFADGTPISNGYYTFDETGKMLIKNGPEGDYFYVNGIKVAEYTGLVEYEGNFYYVAAGAKLVKNVTDRAINKTNDLTFADGTPIPNGKYTFDETGKMLVKNGPDGDYFYVNGIKVAEYTGLVEYEGNFYYVAAGAKLVKNVENRAINKTNGLTFADGTPIPNGNYTFDETGKMVVKNGPEGDFLYVNGVKVPAYEGLVKCNGDYYYVASGAKFVKDIEGRYINKTNGLTLSDGTPIRNGKYSFDADGKMIIPELPRDGMVNEFGGLYYYKDNELQVDAGLIIIDDVYYYVDNNGMVLTSKGVANKTFDYLKPGTYNFASDGKMQIPSSMIVGIRNARDIAILNDSSDLKLKTGLLIRGTELDNAYRSDVTAEQAQYGINKLMNQFGIKFEMDLRAQNDNCKDVFGANVEHKYYDMVFYEQIFTDEGKAIMKDIFTDFANANNYPMYMHCTYGLERTGTVCYVLEAMLGMSEWNLSHDYCYTNGSHEVNVLKVKDGLNTYPGATIKERTEAYLLSCGVTMDQMNAIRSILLAQ